MFGRSIKQPLPRSIWRLTKRGFNVLFTLLPLITFVALFAKWVIGESWELVGILNSVLHLLLIGSFVSLIMNVISRRWQMTVLACLPVVYFLGVYGITFLPNRTLLASATSDLRVITYNIHSEEQYLEPLSAVIREANADIVALQELSSAAADYFRTELSDLYPYQALHTLTGEPIPGQGVLSRYEIKADIYWRNDSLPKRLAHQQVQININGTIVTLFNAHPIHPIMQDGHVFNIGLRTQEIQSVLERAFLVDGAIIIAGDFNMADQSEDYQRVTSHFTDTYRAVGWGLGFTFPDLSVRNAVPGGSMALPIRPIVRLDYLFHNERLRPLSAVVWQSAGGSDHRPVVADYVLTNTPRLQNEG